MYLCYYGNNMLPENVMCNYSTSFTLIMLHVGCCFVEHVQFSKWLLKYCSRLPHNCWENHQLSSFKALKIASQIILIWAKSENPVGFFLSIFTSSFVKINPWHGRYSWYNNQPVSSCYGIVEHTCFDMNIGHHILPLFSFYTVINGQHFLLVVFAYNLSCNQLIVYSLWTVN